MPRSDFSARELVSGIRVSRPPRGLWDALGPLVLTVESTPESPEWAIALELRGCATGHTPRVSLSPGARVDFSVEIRDEAWEIVVRAEATGHSFNIITFRGPSRAFLSYLGALSPAGPFDNTFLEGDFSEKYNLSRDWIGRRSRYAWFVQLKVAGTPPAILRRWLHAFFRHYAKEAGSGKHSEEWAGLIECLGNYKLWASPDEFDAAIRDVIEVATRKPGAISGTELSDIFAFLQDHGKPAERFRLAVALAAQTGATAALAVVLDLLIELQASDVVVAPREFWEENVGRPPMETLFQLMWQKAATRGERGLAIELCQLFYSHEDGGRRRFALGLLPYLNGLQSFEDEEWEPAERHFAQAIEALPPHQSLRTKALLNAFVAHARGIVSTGDAQAAVEYLESVDKEFERLKTEIPRVSLVWESKLRREMLWTRLRAFDLLSGTKDARRVLRDLSALEASVWGRPSERAQQWAKEIEIFDKLANGDLESAEGILEKLVRRAKELELPTQRTEMTVSSALAAKYLLRGEVSLFQRAMKRARASNGFHSRSAWKQSSFSTVMRKSDET